MSWACFFFSSRRRHTRFKCDWSSDVCSSDLEAEDGPGAFETAVRVRPDLMLVDIGLAGFDGYELARRLRTTPETKAAVLVALTGYGRPEDVARSLAAGFDRHAVKPLAVAALAEILGR